MNNHLRNLAESYGVPLSDRSCYNSHIWNGKTLALNFQREVWDDEGERLLFVGDPQPLPDFDLAHEIAHWVVANPVEREFPEYGGDWLTYSPYIANGGLTGGELAKNWEGVLNREEQNFREACADFLGVYWCDIFGIEVKEEWRPINKYSNYTGKLYEVGWEAIIWLRKEGWIP